MTLPLLQNSVEVRAVGDQRGVFARRHLTFGEDVLPLVGWIRTSPSRYTIQLSRDLHLMPLTATGTRAMDPVRGSMFTWCLVNHGCEPNLTADVTRRRFVARRAIAPGEELSFDYDTTEWEMASPFDCQCGARSCRGRVAGFRHLPSELQLRLLERCAPHVQARFGDLAALSPRRG